MFRELKNGNFGWKTVVFIKSGVQEVERAQNRLFQMENSFLLNQVFRRSRQLKIGFFRWKTAVFIKSGVQEVQRAQNRQFQMENSCFYKIMVLGCSESLKSAILDGKQLFLLNQVFRRSRELKIGNFRWKTAVSIKSSFQPGPESLKSAILDGKQLFLLNQMFGRSRELKIGYFRWKASVFIKSAV